MGGFHIALNFLAVIGKMFEDSGLADLLIESGVYGFNTASNLLKEKSYNPGIRGHKLVMEALMRLQWQEMCKWKSERKDDTEVDEEVMSAHIQACKNAVEQRSDDIRACCETVCKDMDKIQKLMEVFRSTGKEHHTCSIFGIPTLRWYSYFSSSFVLKEMGAGSYTWQLSPGWHHTSMPWTGQTTDGGFLCIALTCTSCHRISLKSMKSS